MSFFKTILSFLPWILFLIIAHGSLLTVKIGLLISLFLNILMGIIGINRGIIFWVGLLFFTYATFAVLLFNNMWIMENHGIIANGVLATATWLTILVKKPFTLVYARQDTDPSLWHNPVFLRTNFILSSLWGMVFTINTILDWGKMQHFLLSETAYTTISYILIIGATIFTRWYPKYVRNKRQQCDR